MDWAIFWGAVGAIAGLAALTGLYFAIRTYRRQFARRELQYSVSAVQLINEGAADARLRVMLGDVELAQPHLLTVTIRSTSRVDIPSASFDAGRPLIFSVSPHIVSMGSIAAGTDTIQLSWAGVDIDGAARSVEMPPQLIRPDARGEFSAVVDGPPHVSVTSPIIDVPVVHLSSVSKSLPAAFRAATIWATSAIVAALLATLISLLSGWLTDAIVLVR